ncbi:methyl-accepting chemotaxis protein [Desulfovibrio sp. JC022]|uniref:methyl-accepting chemotaxis protein n=1 Tax=Desulfovibrio sp. JC022 TaxID=2593642 RepID=UPI0013D6E706|nr:HAMP domain-containing methyl-accepting chemotaxis protein [Desulfovibrio sp. JC022]NDV24941.1 methyl-accepting chemotaxis protein [Desulfovibrio sp. JC022]
MFKLRLAHKLTGAFAVLLACALMLGGMGLYSLHTLSQKMEARSSLDEIISTGQEAQSAAFDWLINRETFAVSKDGKHPEPLLKYDELFKNLEGQIVLISGKQDQGADALAAGKYKAAFESFHKVFISYQSHFKKGTEMVRGLREASIGILAKAQSLNKAVARKSRKLKKKQAAGHSDAAVLQSIMVEMNLLAEQKEIAAILLNKPLGFQEMAKDFILYKDEDSGRGLIVDMGKLLGIDKEATMGKSLPMMSATFPNGREAKLFKQLTDLTADYLNSFKGYFAENGNMNKAMAQMVQAEIALRDLGTSIREESAGDYAKAQHAAEQLMWLLSVLAVAVSFVLIALNMFGVVRPIRKIVRDIKRVGDSIASGGEDFKHLESKSTDELGDLAGSFNSMLTAIESSNAETAKAFAVAEGEAESARKALSRAQEAEAKAAEARKEGILRAVASLERIVESLVGASEDLSDQIAGAAAGSEELQQQTASSSSALTELGVSIQEVSNNSSGAAESADQVMRTARSGAEVVDDARQAIFGVRTETDTLKTSLEDLSSRADDIGQIMTVINEIADQTNLLALNAAIEAARAGEAGRGFAVVADEVRKLAEKTLHATTDVGDTIKAIQQSTAKNMKGMESAERAVAKSTGFAEDAEQSLREIVKHAEESNTQVHTIASAVDEQSVAADNISMATENINTSAMDMAETMSRSSSATQALKELAAELDDLIDSLKKEE